MGGPGLARTYPMVDIGYSMRLSTCAVRTSIGMY